MSVGAQSRGVRARGRQPAPGGAPSLLLTALGELVLPKEQPVWTASLLYLLRGMDVAEATARMAIARAADAGWIAGERHGRAVCWRVAENGRALIADVSERVQSLTTPVEHWDGNGIFLNVSVPQEKRMVRKRLYSALGWAGFGNPVPGLWTNPHTDRLEEARAIIDELGLREFTIVSIGRPADMGLTVDEIIKRAWDLDEVAERYRRLLSTYELLTPERGDPLLFSYLALVDEWRRFPAMDPQLPRDVLPEWIGRHAAKTFSDLCRQWGPGARSRWAQLTNELEPA